jgi:hypothetical protein
MTGRELLRALLDIPEDRIDDEIRVTAAYTRCFGIVETYIKPPKESDKSNVILIR